MASAGSLRVGGEYRHSADGSPCAWPGALGRKYPGSDLHAGPPPGQTPIGTAWAPLRRARAGRQAGRPPEACAPAIGGGQLLGQAQDGQQRLAGSFTGQGRFHSRTGGEGPPARLVGLGRYLQPGTPGLCLATKPEST